MRFWLLLGINCFLLVSGSGQGNVLTEIADMEAKSFLRVQKGARAGDDDRTNIIFQKLDLQVDPSVNFIQGSVTTVFIPLIDINTIQFDLSDTLTVDSILYHGSTLSFAHSGDIVVIPFPTTIVTGQVDSVEVFYHGQPSPAEGFGSFIQSQHDSVPIIWTLSEPYGAKDWWPCKQNLHDKIDSVDIVVTTPDSFVVASNGLLVGEIQTGSSKTFYWKHRYPIATYLVAFAVTNYEVYTDTIPLGSKILPVVNYVFPEHLAGAKTETPATISIMHLYDSLFEIYPFHLEKYGHAEFGWGGGMEHQTITFMGGFGFELIAHELAHHWFGDKVTCASWEDIWLNEGFATYLSGLCYENIAPQYWMAFKETRRAGGVKVPNGSVWCDDTTNVSRIFNPYLSYSKGAMVLHTLRWVLGDAKFFEGLKNYLKDVDHAYAFATTTSLRQHLEDVSGKNLEGFFNDWVYGKGYPSYTITWNQDFENNIQVKISQTQSDPSVGYFEMPLPLKFKTAFRDTTIVLNNSQNNQTYSFKLPYLVDSVLFDPEIWILSDSNRVIHESVYDFLFAIYPNPVGEELNLQFQTKTNASAEIEIYNNAGQLMLLQVLDVPSGSCFKKFDTSSFAPGAYRIRVKSGDYKYHASFLKAAN
jgi:aminopeptidase N